MNISIFFPLRAGSQRVIHKNTKPFLSSGESIFQLKMRKLSKLLEITEIVKEVVISTNDKKVVEQATPFLSEKIKLIVRPDHLCLSTTKVKDLIEYVPTVVSENHIFWLHATSPFIDECDYIKAIEMYCELGDEHDSLMSVNEIKQFIWNDESKEVVNVDRSVNPWPNTQDLEPLYEINHAFYISSKVNYMELNDRIGISPKLYICEGVKKIDIDWDEDFRVAQMIAERIR